MEDRGQPNPRTGGLQTREFIAALLDWVGTQPPTLQNIEGVSQVVDFGYAGFKIISEAGDLIRGRRDMDEYPVRLEDRLTSAGGGRNVLIVNGSKRVRIASRDEAATMPVITGLGYNVLRNAANDRWGSGQNPTTLPQPALRLPPVRPAPIRTPPPRPTGPIKKRPPTIERDKDGEPDPLHSVFWIEPSGRVAAGSVLKSRPTTLPLQSKLVSCSTPSTPTMTTLSNGRSYVDRDRLVQPKAAHLGLDRVTNQRHVAFSSGMNYLYLVARHDAPYRGQHRS